MDDLMDTGEAARYFGLAEITLRKWRLSGAGPRFVRLGRSIRYRKADLDDFLASRSFTSTATADADDVD